MGRKALLIDKKRSSREELLLTLREKKYHVTAVSDLKSAKSYDLHAFDLILTDTPIKTPVRTLSLPLTNPNLLEEKPQIIATSDSMKEVMDRVAKVADSEANVFITGESGTGKEVIASLIHTLSPRSANPFIKVNCAALPETLIESEFFGHEKGSYTGAHTQRIGRFERAHTGTLLLDEITEIPLSLQSKLLRVVQEQEFERVGSAHPIPIDVRFISTSNRPIQVALQEKKLREDLFYRLGVIPIHLPPLRDRPEDILPLANHFLAISAEKNKKTPHTLTQPEETLLLSHPWPGNIRQLANLMEQLTVLGNITI